MSKTISAYAGFTATELKNRASIPSAEDITIGDTYIDCANIKLSAVKSVLGDSASGLDTLYKSINVNHYSWFGPGYWRLSSGYMIYVYNNTSKLGDFAAYNHSAPAPSKSAFNTVFNIVSGGGDIDVYATINVGEINWRSTLFSNIDSIQMLIKDGSVTVGNQVLSYNDTRQKNGFDFNVTFFQSEGTTLTVEFYFRADGTNVAPIPNISSHNVTVGVLNPATFGTVALSNDLKSANPTWELIYNTTTSNINQNNDTFTFYGLAIDDNNDGEGDITRFNMELYARLNGGKAWYKVFGPFTITSSGVNIISESLESVWDLTFDDIVDFELRDQ